MPLEGVVLALHPGSCKFEQKVFQAISEKKLPPFDKGFVFQGDREWAGIHAKPGLKRPDIIYVEEVYPAVFEVRPFDVKSTYNHFKPGQISPLTLNSLYGIEEFHNTLRSTIGKHYSSFHLIFREGKLIMPKMASRIYPRGKGSPNLSFEDRPGMGRYAHVTEYISRSLFTQKFHKIQRMIAGIDWKGGIMENHPAYYPVNVTVEIEGNITHITNTRMYHLEANDQYSIETDTTSKVHYKLTNGSDLVEKTTIAPILETYLTV